MIVDAAIYRNGRRAPGRVEVDGVRDTELADGAYVWVGIAEPDAEEFTVLRDEFGLHELAVEDALSAHQRPKVERYEDTVFLVLKTLGLDGSRETLATGEVMLFVGADFVVSVRHGEGSGLGDVRERAETRPDLLACGPWAAVYLLVDRIVDAYEPVATAVRDRIDAIESEVFSGRRVNPVEQIYSIRRQVLELLRSTQPLLGPIERLAHEGVSEVPDDVRPYFRDVADHVHRIIEQAEGFRELLDGILHANLTQIGVRQNEDMRRISAWVAILAVPTAVAGIYGMNFDHMPELRWTFGYPLVVGIVAIACVILYRRFRRAGWL